MLSIPHMIVVFLVVLVVFGPQKLPERDLERQARVAELRKKNAEADAAETRAKDLAQPALADASAATQPPPEAAPDYPVADGPVLKPEADAVPRLDASNGESVAQTTESKPEESAAENPPSHDQQQPA